MTRYYHYTTLADLFRYPGNDYPVIVNRCLHMLEKQYPEAAMELAAFSAYINHHAPDEYEELYTRTFDVQPICYLDLGYVIFGEDYKRGAFLLHMQEEQQKVNNDCGTDLPDNLCNMLTLLDKTQDQDLIDELVVKILVPGVKKMIGEFSESRVELKTKVLRKLHGAIILEELNTGNVYRDAFSALLMVLERDFESVRYESPENTIVNQQHHQSFFSKKSLHESVAGMTTGAASGPLFDNHKPDQL